MLYIIIKVSHNFGVIFALVPPYQSSHLSRLRRASPVSFEQCHLQRKKGIKKEEHVR